VQADWQAVGINVDMTGYEWGTYLTECSQGAQDQLYRLGWLADYPSPDARQAARHGARHA
jgi:ABC-type transport system substrate-binding protein